MNLNSGGGIANGYVPVTIPGGFSSIRVTFDVWANSARVQAYVKDTQNDTYYGIPRGQIISNPPDFVTIGEGECGVASGMAKIGGQTGQGPDRPDFSHDFEIGYIMQASGTGNPSPRDVVVDNWQVWVWP